MKFIITSTDVNEKKWSKENRSGVIRTQEAQAECSRFRHRVRLDLGKSDPYPVGEYSVDLEDAIEVNNWGDLRLVRRLPLVPVSASSSKR